jgi:hypothetical protein
VCGEERRIKARFGDGRERNEREMIGIYEGGKRKSQMKVTELGNIMRWQ